MLLAEKGVRGKGQQPLSPPRHTETPASVSSTVACHHASCAWNHHAFRCDGRCEPAGPGCRQRRWDRRSVRASGRPAVARSGSSNESGNGLRRFPRSRGVRFRPVEPWPSRRPPARRCGSDAPTNCADSHPHVQSPGRGTAPRRAYRVRSNHRGMPFAPGRKPRSSSRHQ